MGFLNGTTLESRFHVSLKAKVKIRKHDMSIFTQKHILRFQVTIYNTESVKILKRSKNLGSKKTCCRECKSISRLFPKERVEITAGTIIYKEARVMRDINTRVKSGEKRMIKRVKNLRLRFRVREFLRSKKIFINNLKCKICAVVITEATEKNTAEVTGAEMTEKL
jgi:hypothetical protein